MALIDMLSIQTDLNSCIIAGEKNTSITFRITKCTGTWVIEKIVRGGTMSVISGNFSKISGVQGEYVTYTFPNKFESAPFCIKSNNEKLIIHAISRDGSYSSTGTPSVLGYYKGNTRASVQDDYAFILGSGDKPKVDSYSNISDIQVFSANAYTFGDKYNHVGYIVVLAKFPKEYTNGVVNISDDSNPSKSASLIRTKITASPNPLVFNSSGSTQTLNVYSNDPDYTIEWSDKDSFHHDYEYYPSSVPPLIRDVFGIKIKLPETNYAYFGTGEILIKSSDNIEAVRIPVYQNGVVAMMPNPSNILLNSSGTPISYNIPIQGIPVLKTINNREIQIGTTFDIEWATISTQLITQPDKWESVLKVTYSAKENISPNKRSISNSFWIYNMGHSIWNSTDPSTMNKGTTIQINQEGNPRFSVTPNKLTIGENGGSLSAVIDTNYTSFTNTSVPDWISSFKYTPNQSGTINIQVVPNSSVETRIATVQFQNGSTLLDTLTITQSGQDLYFDVDPKSIHAPKEGNNYTVTVRTNMQYKMEVKDNTTDFGTTWFTVSQANAIKEIPYLVSVKPNPSSRSFSGRIIFTPTGKPSVTVNITQDGDTPYIIYEPSSTEIDKESHTWEVVRRHNIPEITEKENLVGLSYIIKPPSTGGSGNDVITPPEYPKVTTYIINASKNESSTDRSSYLETSGGGVSARYNVVQRSQIIFDVLDYPNYNPIRDISVPASGAVINIAIRYNVAWNSINNDASWIYFGNKSEPDPSYTSDYRTSIVVEKNVGNAREGTITFKSPRGGVITLRIHQDEDIVKSIKVTPNYTTVDSSSHVIILTVEASHDWSLIQTSKYILPDWLDVDKVEGLAGTTEIKVTIKQALLKKRAAMLYFKLKDFEESDVATIVQNAIENGYDITDVEDDSDWSKRMEAKIRDKYVKVKIRYTGNDLAIITALKTLYETSFA